VNRDLTINLKIVTAGGENSRAASEAISTVTEAARAATAATGTLAQAHTTAATAASSMASAARNVGAAVASNYTKMRQASDGTREYATAMDRLDAKFSEIEEGLKGVNDSLDKMESDRKKLASTDREFLEGVQRLSNGLMSMARSVVLLTAANEEDAASMLRMIARFEAVGQALNGVMGVVQGATKAWQQYALAAELAGGVASVGGFVGRMASTGAAGASVIGGAAGLLGGGALVSEMVDNAVNGTNKTYASDAISGTLTGFAGAVNSVGWLGRAGSMFKPYEESYLSQQKTARMETELTERQRLNRRRDDFSRIAQIESMTKSQVAFETDLQQSRFVSGLQDPARNPDWRDSFQSAYRVNTVTDRALQDRRRELQASIGDENDTTRDQQALGRDKKELEDIERRITDTARERLSIMQQEAETATRIVAAQREGLAQMSRGDARSLANAMKSAADGSLTDKEIGLLRQNNIQGYDDVIRKSQEQIIASDPNKAFIFRDQQQKTNVDELNKNYNIAVNSQMVLKVQAEIDKTAPQWTSEAMKFIQQQVDRIKAEAAEVIKLQADGQRREADQNSKAKNGGPGGVIPASAGPGIK
jgi:hypothetical protein